MKMKDCLFCKIAAGEIPSDCLYQDDQVYVFKDIAPQAPVHFLVIPREHIGSAAEIDGTNAAVQTQLPLTIKPGGKADVKVTLDTGKLEYSGEVIEVLSVITNAPSKPIMNLFITGNVL